MTTLSRAHLLERTPRGDVLSDCEPRFRPFLGPPPTLAAAPPRQVNCSRMKHTLAHCSVLMHSK